MPESVRRKLFAGGAAGGRVPAERAARAGDNLAAAGELLDQFLREDLALAARPLEPFLRPTGHVVGGREQPGMSRQSFAGTGIFVVNDALPKAFALAAALRRSDSRKQRRRRVA